MQTDLRDELDATLDNLGTRFETFKAEHMAALAEERGHREELERKVNGQRFDKRTDPTEPPPVLVYDRQTKQHLPVLSHRHKLADTIERRGDNPLPSMGRVLRGLVLGNRADDARELDEERKALGIISDSSGGVMAPDFLAAQWIDLLRARMVLSQAGAVTIPMPGKALTLAAVAADPGVAWHAENAALGSSDPTFSNLTLSAKTIACVVKLSLELAQDAANIENVLQSALTSAMAGAIDAAGLVGSATNAALAPLGLFNTLNRNTVTGIGAPTSWDWAVDGMYELMLDNVPEENIGALVGHPAIWRKMRKLKTGLTNDNTPLPAPAEVANLAKLWTTAAPLAGGTTAKAIIGDWRDCIVGMRKDISVRLLTESFLGSNLQVALLAYARCDIAAARPQSFCSMEGITV